MADQSELFSYDPGDKSTRFACPFATEAALILAFRDQGQTEPNALTLYKSENPVQQAEGVQFICAAARKAFNLIPFNAMTGHGSPPAHDFDVFLSFREWGVQKKRLQGGTPTLPQSSDSTLSAGSAIGIPSEKCQPSMASG